MRAQPGSGVRDETPSSDAPLGSANPDGCLWSVEVPSYARLMATKLSSIRHSRTFSIGVTIPTPVLTGKRIPFATGSSARSSLTRALTKSSQ